ncbi:hypothetical protein AB1Y20_001929 [Prymnesium parvum]|uniref:Uncharacterized protein n=1 Tax=Prymnesium parvum TaxID=97485 RepID=A0AB34JA80_PRYPA
MDTVDLGSGWHSNHALKLFDSDLINNEQMGRDATRTLATTRKRQRNNQTTPPPTPPSRRQRLPRASPAPRRRPQPRAQDIGRLASSTTGVGRLDHVFPDSLDGYRTYNDRLSTRPQPRERVKS